MTIETIDADTHAAYRETIAIADMYWRIHATFAKNGASSMSAELARAPDYANCTNEMRGQVAQYETLHNPPSALVAYIGDREPNGCGIDREYGRTYWLNTWTGHRLGYATLGRPYRIRGTKVHRVYAWITGRDGREREYTGVGQGIGMAVNLRLTAASKRKLESVA